MVDRRWSMVDGRWSMVDGRSSMVGGRWSMVDGRWSMVDGRWSMVDEILLPRRTVPPQAERRPRNTACTSVDGRLTNEQRRPEHLAAAGEYRRALPATLRDLGVDIGIVQLLVAAAAQSDAVAGAAGA